MPGPVSQSSRGPKDPPRVRHPRGFPPLTPLSELPLHAPGRYDLPYACETTVSVVDVDAVAFDWRCATCLGRARLAVARGQNPVQVWRPSVGTRTRRVTLRWSVQRADYWHRRERP